jgi:hypothetical protein
MPERPDETWNIEQWIEWAGANDQPLLVRVLERYAALLAASLLYREVVGDATSAWDEHVLEAEADFDGVFDHGGF